MSYTEVFEISVAEPLRRKRNWPVRCIKFKFCLWRAFACLFRSMRGLRSMTHILHDLVSVFYLRLLNYNLLQHFPFCEDLLVRKLHIVSQIWVFRIIFLTINITFIGSWYLLNNTLTPCLPTLYPRQFLILRPTLSLFQDVWILHKFLSKPDLPILIWFSVIKWVKCGCVIFLIYIVYSIHRFPLILKPQFLIVLSANT